MVMNEKKFILLYFLMIQLFAKPVNKDYPKNGYLLYFCLRLVSLLNPIEIGMGNA